MSLWLGVGVQVCLASTLPHPLQQFFQLLHHLASHQTLFLASRAWPRSDTCCGIRLSTCQTNFISPFIINRRHRPVTAPARSLGPPQILLPFFSITFTAVFQTLYTTLPMPWSTRTWVLWLPSVSPLFDYTSLCLRNDGLAGVL